MGRGIERENLATYLAHVLAGQVEVRAVRRLGGSEPAIEDPKGFGYGVPLEVECLVDRRPRAFVISRTRPAQGFGHDYPADRAWQALYGHHAYNSFPRHVRSLDVGFVREHGEIVSAADAVEFFQLVEKAEGALYWLDLARMLAAEARDLDRARARVLARFLAETHAERRDEPTLYVRRLRELCGHGECVMGILDSYPDGYPLLPERARETFEQAMVSWRWRLRGYGQRLRRIHGDFHPWNLLFREGTTEFSVLDRSRGEWGEPADDVAALGINYLFFGVQKSARGGRAGVDEPFLQLFRTFLDTYLAASGDAEVFHVLPPFLAFRALVIAHPRWYPDLADASRVALLHFADRMVSTTHFVAEDVMDLWG
ncbi:MAG TPA: phosphotransferase [Candidatus Acidoferrum sp.]|nr:phosphotransferase [Candidatus Acidoferrum sp.]